MVYLLDTAQGSFNLMLQIGAGTGLLYLVRWFWWRASAWCEITAMIASFGIAVFFAVLRKYGIVFGTHEELLMAVIFTTICWVATAYLGPETDHKTLISFYRKVRPFGPGWGPIRTLVEDVVEAEAAIGGSHENMPLALLGWVAGCAMIWSALFCVGNYLYGRNGYALGLLLVFAVSASTLIAVVRRLWR
jgi:hypothetical protein